jgi:hypothetical protein
MSTDTYGIGDIEYCIKKKYITYYEYDEFNKIEEVGSGFVGKVYKANQGKTCVALKSFNLDNFTVKEIIYEVRLGN